MHVKANLQHGVGDVGACEGQILQDASKTPVVRRVSNWSFRVGRDLGAGIHGGCAWFALGHPNTIQDVNHVLALREYHTVGTALNLHPEEVMEFAQILHGKLLLEG
jgi:hypothetical protein